MAAVLVWVVVGWLGVDLVVRGDIHSITRFGPPVLLVGWLAYLVLFAPRIEVYTDRFIDREIWRTYEIGYGAVRDIRIGAGVVIDYEMAGRERRLHPWNAPGIRRVDRHKHGRSEADVLHRAWIADGGSDEATVRINWWQWGVAALLLIACIVW